MKDIGKSTRDKLYNLSKKNKLSFQHLIIRYLHERLLYRISVSKYADKFYLKGGALLYTFSLGDMWRYTMDIDFSLHQIDYDRQKVVEAFKEISAFHDDDGVQFDVGSISSRFIRENDIYGGIRIFIETKLDTIQQRLQVDVGFGDSIYPKPIRITYPVLLDNVAIPSIFAYSVETVISEKFHAMIELSEMNSRMKDYFDVYHLIKAECFNREILEEAIRVTFKQRNTYYRDGHELFNIDFANNINRNNAWNSFLKKINQPASLAFPDVMKEITGKLEPIWNKVLKD
jgi:predicted nucleotidyltransferase component of viral defense system